MILYGWHSGSDTFDKRRRVNFDPPEPQEQHLKRAMAAYRERMGDAPTHIGIHQQDRRDWMNNLTVEFVVVVPGHFYLWRE